MADWTVTTGADPVVNGENFQDVLDNDVACGDTIILEAGAEYYGNFIFPYLGACTGTDADYVTIRTSEPGSITPEGTRITKDYAAYMPKIVANSALGIPAMEFEANAHHYKFIGVEITNVGGAIVTQELVLIGSLSSSGAITYTQMPHHIIFDRVWIHEATNDTTTLDETETTAIRAFNINAHDVTIKECRCAGFRTYVPGGSDVQASNCVLMPNQAQRITITNNYLESWFVSIFMGGTGTGWESPNNATLTSPSFNSGTGVGSATFSSVSNLAVDDLVAFRTTGGTMPVGSVCSGCAVSYQVAKVTGITGSVVDFLAWGSYDGDVTHGNPLRQTPDAPGHAQWNGYLNEDVLIQRNYFMTNFVATEAVWVATGGDPYTVPREDQVNTGTAPKGYIEIKNGRDVLINGNIFDGWETGLTMTTRNQGVASNSGGFPWAGLFNVTISNNWWKKMLNWDRIYTFPIGGPLLQDNELTSVRSGPFTFTNNLIESGWHNIFAALTSADDVTLSHNTYPGIDEAPGNQQMIFGLGAVSNNFIFRDNILSHNEYGFNCQGTPPCWPDKVQEGNIIIDNRSSGTQIADGPLDDDYPDDFIVENHAEVEWIDSVGGNYRLAVDSPYKGMASDDTDPGVNYDTLLAALGLDDGLGRLILRSPF